MRNRHHVGMHGPAAQASIATESMKPHTHSSGSVAFTQCMCSSNVPRSMSVCPCTRAMRASVS